MDRFPSNLPEELEEVCDKFLSYNSKYEDEIIRIVSDERMINFLHDLRLAFNKSNLISSSAVGREHSWKGIMRQVIALMAFKGGLLPDMSDKEFKRERVGSKKVAGIANTFWKFRNYLNKDLSAYKNVANLTLVDLLKICESSNNPEISDSGRSTNNVLSEKLIHVSFNSPTFLQILEAIEERIKAIEKRIENMEERTDSTEPLSYEDERPCMNVPSLRKITDKEKKTIEGKEKAQQGKEKAQQRYFINNTLSCIYDSTLVWQWSLTAQATNIAFDIPLENQISSNQIQDLFKK